MAKCVVVFPGGREENCSQRLVNIGMNYGTSAIVSVLVCI